MSWLVYPEDFDPEYTTEWMTWPSSEDWNDKPMVCTKHKRFIPCRACNGCCDDHTSTDPEDVEMVRRYQNGEPPKPPTDLVYRVYLDGYLEGTYSDAAEAWHVKEMLEAAGAHPDTEIYVRIERDDDER